MIIQGYMLTNSAKYRRSSEPGWVSQWQRQMWAVSGTDGCREMDMTDGVREKTKFIIILHHVADHLTLQSSSLSFCFFLSPLVESQQQQRAGKCNSSGQTLIFSLSFPPTQSFVDIVVSILSFLGWMSVPQKNQKPGNAIRRRGGRGTGTPKLTHIPEGWAKCSAQGLALYSLHICSYIEMGALSLLTS